MEREEKTIAAGSVTLHYLEWPEAGEPVLLLHGLTGRALIWQDVANALQKHGFRILAPDGRGHGLSDKPPGPYDEATLVGDALEVLDRAGVEKAHLVGHSLGGRVALCLAARHPERVRSLVMEDIGPDPRPSDLEEPFPVPFPSRGAALDAFRRAGGASLKKWYAYSLVPVEGGFGLLYSDTAVQAVRQQFLAQDHWPLWLQVKAPVLVLHGEESDVLGRSTLDQMLKERPATRLVSFPKAGHWIHGNAAAAYLNALLPFLRAPAGRP